MSNQSWEEGFDELEGKDIKAYSKDDWEKTKSFIRKEKELSYAEGRREGLETVRKVISDRIQYLIDLKNNNVVIKNDGVELNYLLQALGLEK